MGTYPFYDSTSNSYTYYEDVVIPNKYKRRSYPLYWIERNPKQDIKKNIFKLKDSLFKMG